MEKDKPKIVFIGATKFGLSCLKLINSSPLYNVVGALTLPREFSISYRPAGVRNVLYADIKKYCVSQNIDCMIKHNRKDPNLFKRIKALSPDLILVVGWYHVLTKPWLDLAPTYGLHASLLPNYSGGAPLVWAMINGEKKTGITLFKLVHFSPKGMSTEAQVDSGPMIGQLSTDIYPDDTIATLYDRIELLGLKLLKEHLPMIANGSAKLLPQDERGRRVFPQRSPEDGIIDWSLPALQIFNFIRAQTKPYPGAFTSYGQDKVTIWTIRLAGDAISQSLSPAEIKEVNQEVFVGCGGGPVLEINHMAINGKDKAVFDWWYHKVKPGNGHRFSMNPEAK